MSLFISFNSHQSCYYYYYYYWGWFKKLSDSATKLSIYHLYQRILGSNFRNKINELRWIEGGKKRFILWNDQLVQTTCKAARFG